MKFAAALVLAAPLATAQDSRSHARAIGFNRHAQLVEATIDAEGQLAGRYVTAAARPGNAGAGVLEVRSLTGSGPRLARVEVDGPVLSRTSHANARRFRILSGVRGRDVAVFVSADGRCVMADLDGDAILAGARLGSGASGLLDAVGVGDDALALVAFDGGVALLRLGPEVTSCESIWSRGITCAFVRTASPPDGAYALVEEGADGPVVSLVDADGEVAGRRGLGPAAVARDGGDPAHRPRCDARREGNSLLVTISDPRHKHGVHGIGRIIACDLLAEDGPALLWDGRPWPSHADGWPAITLFGQAVELLPDITGDGVPDIAATAPSGNDRRPSLMALDGRTGAIVAEYVSVPGVRFGVDLSLDPTGRFLLTTSIPSEVPDDLTRPGRVHVFRAPTVDRPTFERLR